MLLNSLAYLSNPLVMPRLFSKVETTNSLPTLRQARKVFLGPPLMSARRSLSTAGAHEKSRKPYTVASVLLIASGVLARNVSDSMSGSERNAEKRNARLLQTSIFPRGW